MSRNTVFFFDRTECLWVLFGGAGGGSGGGSQALNAWLPGSSVADEGEQVGVDRIGLLEGLRRKVGEIEVLQKRLEQNKAQLLVAIESIESKSEGMQCADNTPRVLERLRQEGSVQCRTVGRPRLVVLLSSEPWVFSWRGGGVLSGVSGRCHPPLPNLTPRHSRERGTRLHREQRLRWPEGE